ncbi:outer membrane lipoprotein-sorting protein [Geopsychrobacter electrodiphilus]|uniref:outer membrane lipoprotein-sorting protein n=1 Tax=Geopsychrobacter electrodiphilus TaxID=225196 RepID=UPI000376E10E|nr:outer membrane lipoprotein-sorting protein [Geopsychrobacter electrodiphilus]
MLKFCVILFSCLLFLPSPLWALDLQTLVRKVEQQYMGRSSKSRMEMNIHSKHWQRSLVMDAWSLGRDHFLVRIIEPAKERDVTTLKVDREVWNYLPKVDRVIKVPPSMMGGAWMGSHLTNDDLVKANKIDEDYNLKLLEETKDHLLIECLPKPEAAVVWGKIIYEILLPLEVPGTVAYFDEEMVRVRDLVFDEVQQIDGRNIPLRMTIQPVDEPLERTVIRYSAIDFNIPLTESFFSLRNLKR